MSISQFAERHGGPHSRGSATRFFTEHRRLQALDSLLSASVLPGVLLGDALVGDGLIDQISPELLAAFHQLRGPEADTYDEVRDILGSALQRGDESVLGTVNLIKGQIGESHFLEEARQAGFFAHLAESRNQEAWDVAIEAPGGVTRHIQVKLYGDADGVMAHIRQVQQKVAEGSVFDGDQVVSEIDFAVPADIAQEVQQKVQAAGLDVDILPIHLSADEAAAIVTDGFENVGPEALSHFMSEIAGASLTAAALHGVVNAFLVYKGSKASSDFLEDTGVETAISAGGLSAGMLASKLVLVGGAPAVLVAIVAGVGTRGVLKRISMRGDFAERMTESCSHLRETIRTVLQTPGAEPA